MTTQLRLVEAPELRPRPARGKVATASSKSTGSARRGRGAARGPAGARTARRAASWGDWRLDAGTRRVGRAGVAEARRALEAVVEQTALDRELSEAS